MFIFYEAKVGIREVAPMFFSLQCYTVFYNKHELYLRPHCWEGWAETNTKIHLGKNSVALSNIKEIT